VTYYDKVNYINHNKFHIYYKNIIAPLFMIGGLHPSIIVLHFFNSMSQKFVSHQIRKLM